MNALSTHFNALYFRNERAEQLWFPPNNDPHRHLTLLQNSRLLFTYNSFIVRL